MKYAYTIWQDNHFSNISDVVSATKDIVDYYIITTFPQIKQDNTPLFVSSGINKKRLENTVSTCQKANKKVVLQSIPTPATSRGKEPDWWQGWVYFDTKSDWKQFFHQFLNNSAQHIAIGEQLGADFYLIGAELTATLGQTAYWREMIASLKGRTKKPIGYSHHFSLPLKYYYRWELFFSVVVGHLFRGDKVYADMLSRLLAGNQFHVPDDQLIRVGKSLYQTANVNMADLSFVKLNDYFWYVMDKEYTRKELEKRWEYMQGGGITIKFLSAVRDWIKRYVGETPLWIENDLNMGYTDCSEKYYKLWWEVFLQTHGDLPSVVVVWDASSDYTRWVRTIQQIAESGGVR